MHLHEFQAKKILQKQGVAIPKFAVASSVEEARAFLEKENLDEAVVKIQVHAGGRGKAGGVKFGKTKEEILKHVKNLLGMKMVNEQTGSEGIVASKVMICKPADIEKEYYLGAVIDRENAAPYLIASPEGGVEIEEIAEKSPEKILKLPIALDGTLKPYHLLRFASFMGFKEEMAVQGMKIAKAIAKTFIEYDASMLEINPLICTPSKEMLALDAKMSIDENALFRQSEICTFYDPSQISHSEAKAKEFDLSYIGMDGDIGCMVNGAGLAMATMDVIKLFGGSPANFLDVGGGASKEKVAAGCRIILDDPKVRAILVNIFGGIMNCATIAEGVIHAAKELKIKVPLIVRMEGTNVEEGRKILEESKLAIIPSTSLDDAAKQAVNAAKNSKKQEG